MKQTNDDFIRVQDLWGMFAPRWYWFAASVGFCLAAAVFYLLSTPAIYTRTASILVKEDTQGASAGKAMSDFADLGIFKSNTNINNELITIQSPTLMTEVVSRLSLHETYRVRQGLKTVELYKTSPVSVVFMNPSAQGVAFTIEARSPEEFRLSDFSVEGEDVDGHFTVQAGDSLTTPAGTIAIVTTPQWSDDYLGKDIRYTRGSLHDVTDAYTLALRADLSNEDATIINLSIDDASIQKAEDILHTLIVVYNEKWIQDKNQIAVSTSQFIGDRLNVIENELGHVDDNISRFKSKHLMPDLQAASSMYMSQSAEQKKELFLLQTQLTTAQYIRRELNNQRLDQPLPTNTGLSAENIATQIGEYNTLVLNRNRLIANSSEKNPLVQDLAASLQSLKHTILQSVDNYIVSVNTQIQSIRQQETITTDQLASNPNQAKYLLSVERQQKVKSELYLYLLQKREENELSQAFTAYNTRVITAPRGSFLPTAPRKTNILLVAFALGLLMPAVAIFLKETLDSTVRGRKDLENMDLPLLGEIPLYGERPHFWQRKKREEAPLPLLVEAGNRNILNEAFRVLRSNIDFLGSRREGAQVYMMTSFNPGSGKSFLTANLAVSFALKGKRVLCIDGDMRHASLSTVGGAVDRGLSDYLNGRVSRYQDVLVKNEQYPTAHLIPVGTVPPNPAELLENSRFAALIAQARSEYDYIFVDCPPVDIVADAQIVEQVVDRTFFVVRAGLLDRTMLPELERMHQEKRFKNMAMILNATCSTSGRYGYRYGYKYGYGYGSHYGYSYGK